jgi:hypothetical protein
MVWLWASVISDGEDCCSESRPNLEKKKWGGVNSKNKNNIRTSSYAGVLLKK